MSKGTFNFSGSIFHNKNLDFVLISVFVILFFSVFYHPFFFGDELVPLAAGVKSNYSFFGIFQEVNLYKPRFFYNGLVSIFTAFNVPRMGYCFALIVSMTWVSFALYYFIRYELMASRHLAWLVFFVVMTSRFGMMFYYDYVSGLIELLSTALLLTSLLFLWKALRDGLNIKFSILSLLFAIFCVFTHERYGVAFFAVGVGILFVELFWKKNKRPRIIALALFLAFSPVVLFYMANAFFGGLSPLTGTAGQKISLGLDNIFSGLTYFYNIVFGGNYGKEWFWGKYNYQNSIGMVISGFSVFIFTAVLLFVFFKGLYVKTNLVLAFFVFSIFSSFVFVAALTGLDRQEARFMFPAGIFVVLFWIVLLRKPWSIALIYLTLIGNLAYMFLGSHNSIYNVVASKTAMSLSSSLGSVIPDGKRAIVLGVNEDNSWTIGPGGSGEIFSRFNLSPSLRLDPYSKNAVFNPLLYDFSLIFSGYDQNMVPRYRKASVNEALRQIGYVDFSQLPVYSFVEDGSTWNKWRWKGKPIIQSGSVEVSPDVEGYISHSAEEMNGRWIVYSARVKSGRSVPMRLQVNWHKKSSDDLISTSISVFYPSLEWKKYAMFLSVPTGAELGQIYMNLHDGANGIVEVNSVELR